MDMYLGWVKQKYFCLDKVIVVDGLLSSLPALFYLSFEAVMLAVGHLLCMCLSLCISYPDKKAVKQNILFTKILGLWQVFDSYLADSEGSNLIR